jgi:hypothetical protein
VVGLDLNFFVEDYNFKIKLKVFGIFFVFKVLDDFFGLYEVDIDHLKKAHPCLRPLL